MDCILRGLGLISLFQDLGGRGGLLERALVLVLSGWVFLFFVWKVWFCGFVIAGREEKEKGNEGKGGGYICSLPPSHPPYWRAVLVGIW